jgi:hypothetical protein
MHNPFDQLAKRVGKKALAASGRTVVEHEIFRDAQRVDIRHEPDPARTRERALLGLLGRLAAVLCLIEVYGHTLQGEELRACLIKHFMHWQEQACTRRARNKKRRAKGLPPEPLVAPMLWIVTASASARMLCELKVEPAPDWHQGVYFFCHSVLRVGIVVASKLPRDRSTLLVRIMAAGPLLSDAIADLRALPGNAHERAVAQRIMLGLQRAIGKKPRRTRREKEFVMSMQDSWEQARKLGLRQGKTAGKAEARAEDVLTVLRVRGIAVPKAARERILAEKNTARLQRWHQRAILAASVTEVLDQRRRAA